MNVWLIDIIHNVDILCNIVFWWMLGFYMLGYAKSRHMHLNIGRKSFVVWLIAVIGVVFIPSKAALEQMLG